jgi:transposase-like protein
MSGKKDLELLNKENLIVQMRHKEGKTLETIARELGYANASGVQKAYKRAMTRIEHPDAEEYFQAQVERLDALIETYTLPATNGNLRSAEFLLRVMNQQADLLGLKAPVQIQQEVTHNGPRNLDEEVTELARVIEYIEGVAADITTLPAKQNKGKQAEVDATGAEGTITA